MQRDSIDSYLFHLPGDEAEAEAEAERATMHLDPLNQGLYSPPAAWPWPYAANLSPGSAPPIDGSAAVPIPPHYAPQPLPHFHQSSASSSSREIPPSVPKVAIPRAPSHNSQSQRRRSARACEPCRQRKIKCDGERPGCKQCQENHVRCYYQDIKRIRDQKQMRFLTKKADNFQRLLEDLESDADLVNARRIRRTLTAYDNPWPTDDDTESDESVGSLDEIDQVEEDISRDPRSVAMGFFGKNSEVSWMQKLEGTADHEEQHAWTESAEAQPGTRRPETRVSEMSYFLDDLDIPYDDSVEDYELPPRELADSYFQAYTKTVNPAFNAIRKEPFLGQYRRCFDPTVRPPRRWQAVLNLIFAIGCRYYRFIDGPDTPTCDDLTFLSRARKLSLKGDVLFEHANLQQIQLEFLAAFYLITLGQVNRASTLSGMAFRSAISLGINLRNVDRNVPYESKEARSRLWWSVFLLEQLLTGITGRVSCMSESLSSTPLPLPYEEEVFSRPDVKNVIDSPKELDKRLKLTLFQSGDDARTAAEWLRQCEPSESLFFHCIVDITTITQAVINRVYSIQGMRDRASKVEQRIRHYSHVMEMWLSKVPPAYRFTEHASDVFHVRPNSPYQRERIYLAISFYSARITLCRPCLTHTKWRSTTTSPERVHPRTQLRADMSLTCIRAACDLISIFPEKPDIRWLATTTPWWSILHFLMQATTALLLGLSSWPDFRGSPPTATRSSSGPSPSIAVSVPIALTNTKKAFKWLHYLAKSNRAAQKAFLFCDRFLRRIAPNLGLNLSGLPDKESLPELTGELGEDPGMVYEWEN